MNEPAKQNVPELRFPEFDGEWDETTLGENANKPSYGMNAAATTFDGTHKYLRITDISEDERKFIPSPLTSPKPPISAEYEIKENDIVFARTGASTGKSYLYNSKDGKLYFAGFLIRFSIKNMDARFIFAQTLRDRFRNWVQVISMRSGQPGINAQEYSTFCFNTPTIPEQQKIASFFSAVDEKIAQLQEKKTLLEAYKKGCMQKLFSQTLRFKDDNGNDYPDWEEKRLGEQGVLKSGAGFPDSEQGGVHGIPFYKVSDMNLIGNEMKMFHANNFVTNEQIKRLKYKPITLPSLIFAKVGAAIFLERKRLANECLIDNNMMAFTPNSSAKIEFVKYLFDVTRLSKYAQVGALPSYNAGDIASIKVKIPHPNEQQKIADFLSAIDDKITHANAQLEQTKTFKKGLLQKMFV